MTTSSLRARLEALEANVADLEPVEPVRIHRCRGPKVTAADRKAAARAHPGSEIIFTCVVDASIPE